MIELTNAEKLEILSKSHVAYTVVKDGKIITDTKYHRPQFEPTEKYHRCWCHMNKGARIEADEVCPHCAGAARGYRHTVYAKSIITLAIEKLMANHTALQTLFYVRKHPEKESGIQILKITITLKGGNTAVDEDELVWKIAHVIDIVPNEGCRVYKYSRGKEVDVDMFDAFQLNSKLIKEAPNILFANSSGMIDFVLKHKKFNQYTGFMQCFNLVDIVIPRNSFFMFYMYLYAQYPVVEFIVKMGYMDLVAKIMRELANGYNKENIRMRAGELTKILNAEATNGSMALTVPKYIADDLNAKEAFVREYVVWGDICQMSEDGPISKENYLAATRNNVYPHLDYRIEDIPNIMKFGYTIKDVIKYLRKQVLLNPPQYRNSYGHYDYGNVFTYWKDYLNMCDLMGVKHDKFPVNIKVAHDNVQKAFQAQKNAMSDRMIAQISEVAEKSIPDTQKYKDGQYEIVMPHSVSDIVQEGQAQHNCVGSYVDRVVKRHSLVFFIRKKDDPNKSLVTAEYRNGKITQLYYKNNQRVNDKEIIDVAAEFCKKLIHNRELIA
jgi:hypothetical protein